MEEGHYISILLLFFLNLESRKVIHNMYYLITKENEKLHTGTNIVFYVTMH